MKLPLIGLAVLLYVWLATFRLRAALVICIGLLATALYSVAIIPGSSILKIAFPALLLGYAVAHIGKRERVGLDREFLAWAGVLMMVALVGLMVAGRRAAAMSAAWQVGGPMLLGLVVAGAARSERTLRVIAWGFVVCATASALVALAQASELAVLAPVARLTSATENLDPRRVPGPFNNPNGLAAVLTMAMPLAVALYAGTRRVRRRAAVLLILATLSLALILTYSRSGWVGAVTGLTVLLMCRAIRPRIVLPLGVMAAAALALYFAVGGHESLVRVRLGELALDTVFGVNSFAERLVLWDKALTITRQHPIVGIGFGNFPSAEIAGRFRWVGGLVTHNVFLTVLVELGIAGLAVFTALIARTCANFISSARGREDAGLSLLSWGFLAVMVSYFTGQGMAHGALVSELMWVLIGLSFAARAVAAEARAGAAVTVAGVRRSWEV